MLRPGGALLVADFRPSGRRHSLRSRAGARRHGDAIPLEDLATAGGLRIEAGGDLPQLRQRHDDYLRRLRKIEGRYAACRR